MGMSNYIHENRLKLLCIRNIGILHTKVDGKSLRYGDVNIRTENEHRLFGISKTHDGCWIYEMWYAQNVRGISILRTSANASTRGKLDFRVSS